MILKSQQNRNELVTRPGDLVQGMDASGFFAYDKCNFAELKVDSDNLQVNKQIT